jgi:hypothetical protein
MRLLSVFAALLLSAASAAAQSVSGGDGRPVPAGPLLADGRRAPATRRTSGRPPGSHRCSATDTWTEAAGSGAGIGGVTEP